MFLLSKMPRSGLRFFQNRSIVMLLLAGLAGFAAAFAAKQHIQGQVRLLEDQARTPMVQRVVAAYDLPSGTRLSNEQLAIRSVPASLVPSDSLSPERFTELQDTVLRAPLRAGDLILPVHTASHQHTAFSARLAQGRRAITMPVDAINSVSGLLEPGDLIDLYVSFEYQRRRITAPLLQGVLVLATGMQTQHDPLLDQQRPAAYATVTLDAAPEDAVKLVAARQAASITAVLRHPHDGSPSQKAVRGDLASLLGVNSPSPKKPKKVPVLYGNKAVRSVPQLLAPPTMVRANGVFDLPYLPELTSAENRAVPAVDMSTAALGQQNYHLDDDLQDDEE